MRKMKKVMAAMLAATMVMSMGITAFAALPTVDEAMGVNPKISKTYTINHGTAPAETFTYTFKPDMYLNNAGVADNTVTVPELNPVTVSFEALSRTVSNDVEIPIKAALDAGKFEKIGIYKYEISETAGKTAGVSYTNEKAYLVLTILYDSNSKKNFVAAMHFETETGEKVTDETLESLFNNTYDSGTLNVKKVIAGNLADITKKFEFTVVLEADQGTVIDSEISLKLNDGVVSEVSELSETSGGYTLTEEVNSENKVIKQTYKFYLGQDDTFSFDNVPATVTYAVSEENGDYTPSEKWDDTSISNALAGEEDDTIDVAVENVADIDGVVVTNTMGTTVDTGIMLDSIPYVLLLVVVALGMFAVVGKKRSDDLF